MHSASVEESRSLVFSVQACTNYIAGVTTRLGRRAWNNPTARVLGVAGLGFAAGTLRPTVGAYNAGRQRGHDTGFAHGLIKGEEVERSMQRRLTHKTALLRTA